MDKEYQLKILGNILWVLQGTVNAEVIEQLTAYVSREIAKLSQD